ncbi:centrosomal protein of 152 kDa [Brachyhypopomus gauderio]|uniref:centrosomal protein of 152 kDa n=1 Tax=Brachyhypopomus gauderio TaxID=698409 RepID=UPI004041398B
MSIDFDSAALQTQHEEEEDYDEEDYAREQELHKLLTDLPDDMLEDSQDSSPELDLSTCSHPGKNRPQHFYEHSEWSNQPGPLPVEDNPQDGYDQSHHQGCTYDNTASQPNGHVRRLQGGMDHPPQAWDTHHRGDCVYSSAGTADSDGADNYSSGEGYEQETYPHTGEHAIKQNHFQNFGNGITESNSVGTYKVSYRPQKPASPPQLFNTQAPSQHDHFNQLQRDFLDSSPGTADAQECAQLKILNKAQSRQIEELEQRLEDSRRKMRYVEHQFAIVRDEKEGLAVSLKESSRLIEEVKERESQLKVKVQSLEKQIQVFSEREQENIKKQHATEAAVDSMQQQMMELCRSDTLTRAREQHDRDMAVMKEQYEARTLDLQQQIDAHAHSLDQQRALQVAVGPVAQTKGSVCVCVCVCACVCAWQVQAAQRLREQVRELDQQREKDQVERAKVVNTLTKRLEESQQQCAQLLHTGSVQEMSQMQLKLQQAQSSRNISEDMNRTLQEELKELKEHITLYESAVKLGAVSFDLSADWENHLSQSCIDLGMKAVKRSNGRKQSPPVSSDSVLPKGDVVRELQIELQRCLAQLKTKRQKISQLQEELKTSHQHEEQLRTQLTGAERSVKESAVRESCLQKHLERPSTAPHDQLDSLEEERRQLRERVETLEAQNKDLKQSEEKVKAANSELCTKMREMIQELDQEKQEAAERYERTQQQYRDDVVQRVRAELLQEHTTRVEHLSTQHQQHIQQLESKLADLSREVLAVQECYISVCKEKDKLEETLQSRIDDERKLRELELKKREEAEMALQKQEAHLASQHQQAFAEFKAQCTRDSERELQREVAKQREQLEKTWACRLEEAVKERRGVRASTQEGSSQTERTEPAAQPVSLQQLEARLGAQRTALQREADGALARAVEEAVRRAERELQQKHTQDVSSQVEGAVSRAYGLWIQDLTSLPEYKTSLQTEKEQWEKLQQQHVQEQISKAVKAAEGRWQETMEEKHKELEDYRRRNGELEEQVVSLNTQLERCVEERASLLESELSAARSTWSRETQEEVSGLRAQLQREQQENQARLEMSTERAREETLAQAQKILKKKEEEWRGQHAVRLREEQGRTQEEVLAELKEVLMELQNLEREVWEDGGSSDVGVRARLRAVCSEALSTAVAHTKQECLKSGEDTLRRLLKTSQEQREKELQAVRGSAARPEDGVCGRAGCAETVAKLQKNRQDLQRHLEKTCRQLQRTVRQHKNTLHTLREDHEEVLRRERDSHAKELEQIKLTICKETGGADGQQSLQAGLEEMKLQYMKAVQKIRGDMLHYLQESKERAAELIRAEVLRERQDTARRMRTYYLTCLQELLDDGAQTTGAEKKIISAASKLAAMAKVLETPQPKKKPQRNPDVQVPFSNPETNNEHLARVSGAAASGQSLSVTAENQEDCKKNQVRHIRSVTETKHALHRAKRGGLALGDKTSPPDLLGSVRGSAADGLGVAEHVTPVSLHHRAPKALADVASSSVPNGDVSSANVTLRKQSRDVYLIGRESGRTTSPQVAGDPSLIEEAPVRDAAQSDWSLSSNGPTCTNVYLTNYPSKNVVRPLLVAGLPVHDLDFGSTLGDDSDVTVYKEMVKKPTCLKPKQGTGVHTTTAREPIPGSEKERIHALCTKNLFSEFKVRQQDSGFDSPSSHIQK